MLTQSGAPGSVDPVVSFGVKSTIKLLSCYKMFSSCFLVSFGVQDHSLLSCHYHF